MGLLPRITTNKTDGSTTLTLTNFNTFSETAFRWGEKQKLFLCAPKIISALNFFSQNKLLTKVGDTVFGVKISRFDMALGEYLLANNFRMSTAELASRLAATHLPLTLTRLTYRLSHTATCKAAAIT